MNCVAYELPARAPPMLPVVGGLELDLDTVAGVIAIGAVLEAVLSSGVARLAGAILGCLTSGRLAFCVADGGGPWPRSSVRLWLLRAGMIMPNSPSLALVSARDTPKLTDLEIGFEAVLATLRLVPSPHWVFRHDK